jgi:hypothetical protein
MALISGTAGQQNNQNLNPEPPHRIKKHAVIKRRTVFFILFIIIA